MSNTKPAPPKKPLSGYMLYLVDNRGRVTKEFPSDKPKEIVSRLATEWTNLSVADKKTYNDRQEVNKQKYQQEIKAYEEKYGKVEKKSSINNFKININNIEKAQSKSKSKSPSKKVEKKEKKVKSKRC